MNARRFATMTGNLLARKGEASPSVVSEDPNVHSTYTTDTLVKQTELRVMAFPKREREVEPATMHFEWPDNIEPSEQQLAQELREYTPPESVQPKPELTVAPEPAAVTPPAELPEEPAPVVSPLRVSTLSAPSRPSRAHAEPERPARVQAEPERPAEPLPAERRSFFSESGGEKRHRMSLGLTQEEHERLGIVAVKKGLTRHQLMRDALDHYFGKLASDYKAECACIAVGGCDNSCDEDGNA
jgi:hypothetical protein